MYFLFHSSIHQQITISAFSASRRGNSPLRRLSWDKSSKFTLSRQVHPSVGILGLGKFLLTHKCPKHQSRSPTVRPKRPRHVDLSSGTVLLRYASLVSPARNWPSRKCSVGLFDSWTWTVSVSFGHRWLPLLAMIELSLKQWIICAHSVIQPETSPWTWRSW